MQIVRTILWVLLLVALLLFSIANWSPTVTVRIWENLVIDTKIPAIVVITFLIGFVPMWLYHRADKWRMKRKIASLENAARTAAATPVTTTRTEIEEAPSAPDSRSDPDTPLKPAETPAAAADETRVDTDRPDPDAPPTYRPPQI